MSINYYDKSIKPFFGVVEEIIDDTYVRVRCFGIHPIDKEAVPTEDLPPALVLYPTTGGQVSGGDISHNIEIDAWVMGYFVDFPFCMQPIVTNVIRGAAYSMSTYPSGGGKFVDDGSNYDSGSSDDMGNDGGTMSIPGDSNIQKGYNYVYSKLVAEGSSRDPHMHTSAWIGVLRVEEPNLNPAVMGGYKGRAHGICQWLNPRRAQLYKRYGPTKKLNEQLDFMWWELNNDERPAKKRWLSATNMADAVAGGAAFERAADAPNGRVNRNSPIYRKRLKLAYQTYNSIKFTGGAQVTGIASPQSRGDV